ncbi:MAG: hypothetical protein O7F71_12675 [Gammaproteobacteria bacterium]|nr:hypothetical protein [Gammaproteobacteria bacterium]
MNFPSNRSPTVVSRLDDNPEGSSLHGSETLVDYVISSVCGEHQSASGRKGSTRTIDDVRPSIGLFTCDAVYLSSLRTLAYL